MLVQGAKGGGGNSFQQNPDNLRSTDTFEGVLGLCIGPIKGPVRGLKSVKLDDTAVENETGELNFLDFTMALGDGDPAKFPQAIQLKLGGGASPIPIGLQLTNSTNDGQPGPWIVRTLPNTNADFIDMRFVVSQLFHQDKYGIFATTATIEIEVKPTGSTTWINPMAVAPEEPYNEQGQVINGTLGSLFKLFIPRASYDDNGDWNFTGDGTFRIFGKTTQASVYELRLAVPNTDAWADTSWDIRCRLIEDESYTGGENGVDQDRRIVQWESISAVYATILGTHEDWRGVAWVQLYGKASDQLNGVPEVTGEYDTKIVSVPPSTIYNPDTRQYSAGIWDGSWNKAYTNDPAWVINDAISDSLSGLSLIAQGSFLNKWDALELSKWCSQLVPDGDGGTHPRYSLNVSIAQPQKADEFIRYLAGAVGALAWDQGNGEWRVKADKPENPVDIFTLDNIEGEFVYSHTDVDTRFNDIIGKFSNAEMDYREDAVRLYDNPSIAHLGRKPTTIALVGCTNRQEAMRRVKIRQRTAINEHKIVNFTTNRRGRNVFPLDTILVADGALGDSEQRTTGRMISISSDRKTITVRDNMRLEVGVAYTLKFARPNPQYDPESNDQPIGDWDKPTIVVSRTITNTSGERGNVKVLKIDPALPADADENVVVALEATNLATLPRMFRVTNVTTGDDGERIMISAINVDTGKWDAADGVSKEDTVFQDLRGAVPMPLAPPSGDVLQLVISDTPQGKIATLIATWRRPASSFLSGYRVGYSNNGGAINWVVDRGQDPQWQLVNPAPGDYKVYITALDRRGGESRPLVDVQRVSKEDVTGVVNWEDVLDPDGTKPEDNATSGAPSGTQVAGRDAQDVVDDIAFNADSMLSVALTVNGFQAYVDARTFVEGQPLSTRFLQEHQERIDGQNAIVSDMALLGAKSPDGSSWVLNASTVQSGTDPDTGLPVTLATTLDTLGVKTAEHTGDIAFLRSVVVDDTGITSKMVLRASADGSIVGVTITSTGENKGEVAIAAPVFKIVDPNGGTPFTPFLIEDGIVKMLTVQIDTLKPGTKGSIGVPTIVTNLNSYSGLGTGTDDVLLTGTVTLNGPGIIDVSTMLNIGRAGANPWTVFIRIGGVAGPSSSGQNSLQDVVNPMWARYIATAGTYTVEVIGRIHSSDTVRNRTMRAFPMHGAI